jgi:hypothetical protein
MTLAGPSGTVGARDYPTAAYMPAAAVNAALRPVRTVSVRFTHPVWAC